MLDHLGMTLFETDAGTHLSMQLYIELMVQKLEIDVSSGRKPVVPMVGDITVMTPCNEADKKLLMSGTGMIGWTSATGRPGLRVYHSRIARYMSDPVKGALEAMRRIVKYAWLTKDLCLFQSWGIGGKKWRFYSDSDQSSNKEAVAKAKSQLSYVRVLGTAPILLGDRSRRVSNLESPTTTALVLSTMVCTCLFVILKCRSCTWTYRARRRRSMLLRWRLMKSCTRLTFRTNWATSFLAQSLSRWIMPARLH